MRCLARGRLNKEIAAELGISFSAVHKHQHSIFRKLQVGNRTEADLKWMLARSEV
jgi:DNA-binding NarL/FixJ family response regulator